MDGVLVAVDVEHEDFLNAVEKQDLDPWAWPVPFELHTASRRRVDARQRDVELGERCQESASGLERLAFDRRTLAVEPSGLGSVR
ncbi:hypothetical protein [Cellulomonas marina]|uniref:hypothetical protein n=1 Tax=Cellulomonas marina TaxID=988821 RepID=UPI001113D5AF|nr:hypothetical protein [Cellulomonas marina]